MVRQDRARLGGALDCRASLAKRRRRSRLLGETLAAAKLWAASGRVRGGVIRQTVGGGLC